MTGITSDIAVAGALAASVYAVAAFSQLVVGRLVDRHPVKPILFVVAVCQAALVFVMSMQVDYLLFVAALLSMTFVFGQIPITDAVLSRYVPDAWRAKVLSVKFLLNIGVGAVSLMTARMILASGGGFETVVLVLAIGACFIVLGAFLLPTKTDPVAVSATGSAV